MGREDCVYRMMPLFLAFSKGSVQIWNSEQVGMGKYEKWLSSILDKLSLKYSKSNSVGISSSTCLCSLGVQGRSG